MLFLYFQIQAVGMNRGGYHYLLGGIVGILCALYNKYIFVNSFQIKLIEILIYLNESRFN